MPKEFTTEDIVSDAILQIQELVELEKNPKEQYPFAGYIFSILFNCQRENLEKLQEKREYLSNELPNLKQGKGTWKIFKEALEGVDTLVEVSQDKTISTKHILKRHLDSAVEESKAKVRRIQEELGKTDDSNLAETQSADRGR